MLPSLGSGGRLLKVVCRVYGINAPPFSVPVCNISLLSEFVATGSASFSCRANEPAESHARLKSVPRNRYPNRHPTASHRHCAGQVTTCSCRKMHYTYQSVPVKSIVRMTEPDEAADFIPEMLVREACSEKHAVSSTQTPFKAFQIQHY